MRRYVCVMSIENNDNWCSIISLEFLVKLYNYFNHIPGQILIEMRTYPSESSCANFYRIPMYFLCFYSSLPDPMHPLNALVGYHVLCLWYSIPVWQHNSNGIIFFIKHSLELVLDRCP